MSVTPAQLRAWAAREDDDGIWIAEARARLDAAADTIEELTRPRHDNYAGWCLACDQGWPCGWIKEHPDDH